MRNPTMRSSSKAATPDACSAAIAASTRVRAAGGSHQRVGSSGSISLSLACLDATRAAAASRCSASNGTIRGFLVMGGEYTGSAEGDRAIPADVDALAVADLRQLVREQYEHWNLHVVQLGSHG